MSSDDLFYGPQPLRRSRRSPTIPHALLVRQLFAPFAAVLQFSVVWIAIGSTSLPFMEVFKATANQTSLASKSTVLRTEKKSYSYAQLIESSRHISNLLCSSGLDSSESGHLRGARVRIVAKPSAEFVAGLLGTWLCGRVSVPLALSYPEAELLHLMNDSVHVLLIWGLAWKNCVTRYKDWTL